MTLKEAEFPLLFYGYEWDEIIEGKLVGKI